MENMLYDMIKKMDEKLSEVYDIVSSINNGLRKKTSTEITDAEIEQINKSNRGVVAEQMLDIIYSFQSEQGFALHSVLMRRVYRKLPGKAPEFLMIINMLIQNKQIEEFMYEESVAYKLTEHGYAQQKDKHKLCKDEMQRPKLNLKPKRPVDKGAWEAAGFGPRKVDPPATNIIKSATGEDIDLDGVIDLTR